MKGLLFHKSPVHCQSDTKHFILFPYNRRYDAYSERFEAARKRLAEIAELRQERNAKKTRIRLFMENMNSHQELVQSFDEELWYSTVDYVTVYEDKRLVFTFRDGRQVEITAELWRAA